MSDHIFDLDDGEFLYQMDDDYALGSDGHIVQNAGGGMGMDLNTGEFHMTSGWDTGDDQSWDDEDFIPAGNSTSQRAQRELTPEEIRRNKEAAAQIQKSIEQSVKQSKKAQNYIETVDAGIMVFFAFIITAAIIALLGVKHILLVFAILFPIVVIVMALIANK